MEEDRSGGRVVEDLVLGTEGHDGGKYRTGYGSVGR